MTLSDEQLERQEFEKVKYQKWLWIWERDLLLLARRHTAWWNKANELGFSNEKINRPWTHEDEGRHIPYKEINRF